MRSVFQHGTVSPFLSSFSLLGIELGASLLFSHSTDVNYLFLSFIFQRGIVLLRYLALSVGDFVCVCVFQVHLSSSHCLSAVGFKSSVVFFFFFLRHSLSLSRSYSLPTFNFFFPSSCSPSALNSTPHPSRPQTRPPSTCTTTAWAATENSSASSATRL